jgi:hemerythrin superfamily protein
MKQTGTSDIVALLEKDHDLAKTLLEEIDNAAAEAREELFLKLVPTLAAHEVAEEIVVYPAIRDLLPDGEEQAEARLHEQEEAEQKLTQLETMDPASAEFASEMHGLMLAVLEHAEAEEENVFPLLEALSERAELGESYEKAKMAGATDARSEPEPGSGRVAALFGRARDAARKV